MNTPTLTTRRAFLANLSTAAAVTVAAPIVSALPLPVSQPKRASVPKLEWKPSPYGLPNEAVAFVYGAIWIGGYYYGGRQQIQWAFGSGPIVGRCETTDQARAAIQAEWDKLCGAEPSEPPAPVLPKVRGIEWIAKSDTCWIGATGLTKALIVCDRSTQLFYSYPEMKPNNTFLTLEAAKQAAQNHWNQTVLSALA